jgi:biotin transporter BioY
MMLKNFKTKENKVLIEAVLPRNGNRILALAMDIILILSFAILTGVSAKLKIEIGLVPITMQTAVVLLSGVFLGSKKGAMSQITYLLGGISGLPWFSRGGGLVYILSPTFGYILGFVAAAYVTGKLTESSWNNNIIGAFLTIIFGNVFIYALGLLWLAGFVGFSKVLSVGLYPFIFGEMLKMVLASLISIFSLKINKK